MLRLVLRRLEEGWAMGGLIHTSRVSLAAPSQSGSAPHVLLLLISRLCAWSGTHSDALHAARRAARCMAFCVFQPGPRVTTEPFHS